MGRIESGSWNIARNCLGDVFDFHMLTLISDRQKALIDAVEEISEAYMLTIFGNAVASRAPKGHCQAYKTTSEVSLSCKRFCSSRRRFLSPMFFFFFGCVSDPSRLPLLRILLGLVQLRSRYVGIVEPADEWEQVPEEAHEPEQESEQEQDKEVVISIAAGETICALCGLSLANTGTLRRHLRDYHRRAVVPGRRGAPRRRGPAPDRREYLRCGYLDRKARQGASTRGPVTATLLVQEGYDIQQSRVLDHTL
ncbi:uncharacterized protein V1513DRAFT_466450 [Lipomyces chichibuensis]|uniref:uncharacterized protein n=1 Tax=Lipomyces chichibuensis TaxID=1546026 RepID=UPI003343A7A4